MIRVLANASSLKRDSLMDGREKANLQLNQKFSGDVIGGFKNGVNGGSSGFEFRIE